jgi:hypothetical protein
MVDALYVHRVWYTEEAQVNNRLQKVSSQRQQPRADGMVGRICHVGHCIAVGRLSHPSQQLNDGKGWPTDAGQRLMSCPMQAHCIAEKHFPECYKASSAHLSLKS